MSEEDLKRVEESTNNAHKRVDELGESMHQGFTDLRKEMKLDKDAIMRAIQSIGNKPMPSNLPVIAIFTTVIIAVSGMFATSINYVDASSKERHNTAIAIMTEKVKSDTIKIEHNREILNLTRQLLEEQIESAKTHMKKGI